MPSYRMQSSKYNYYTDLGDADKQSVHSGAAYWVNLEAIVNFDWHNINQIKNYWGENGFYRYKGWEVLGVRLEGSLHEYQTVRPGIGQK